VKFAELYGRPAARYGSEDRRTAGQILADAFSGGGAVKLPRGFGRKKDPHRTPMSLRYQACLRTVLNEARHAKRKAAGRWVWKLSEETETANQGE